MMQMRNIHDAKSQLSHLIKLVYAGEEVIICKAGKPMVKLGVRVHAIDSSKEMIELAMQRTPLEIRELICYQVADVTKAEIFDKIDGNFDCVICNMALMDISDIASLFQGVSKLLKLHGSFIVTQTHPCFEKAVGPIFHETEEGCGTT